MLERKGVVFTEYKHQKLCNFYPALCPPSPASFDTEVLRASIATRCEGLRDCPADLDKICPSPTTSATVNRHVPQHAK